MPSLRMARIKNANKTKNVQPFVFRRVFFFSLRRPPSSLCCLLLLLSSVPFVRISRTMIFLFYFCYHRIQCALGTLSIPALAPFFVGRRFFFFEFSQNEIKGTRNYFLLLFYVCLCVCVSVSSSSTECAGALSISITASLCLSLCGAVLLCIEISCRTFSLSPSFDDLQQMRREKG